MSDLIATSLAVAFGPRPLFQDVSLTIDAGDRIALVGPNGAGKTTLLRVLAGRLTPTQGEVRLPSHLRISLHDQRPERTGQTLREYVAPPHMVALEARLRELELAMASGDEAVMRAYDEVRTEYDVAGGEGWEVRVETVLRGLGFREEQHSQSLTTLSGGELTRASLGRALASDPDVLLLDEPTNHLDMESIDWLQEHLQGLRGGLVLVSHDRWFIESVCTSVVEVADGRARTFRGTFVEYRAQQAVEAVSHERQLERMKTEMARLQRFVDRFQAGTRSRQATSRVKMLERLRSEVPQYADLSQRRSLSFRLPTPDRSGATTFDVRGIELGFDPGDAAAPPAGAPGSDPLGSRVLLRPTDFVIERGEKVALLGRNGTGKSTLLHSLAAACIPLVKPPKGFVRGDIRVGYNVTARLLSQHDSELRDDMTMLGNMQVANSDIARRDAMSLLGLFGFRGDDAERKVGNLSGGERRRLLLAMALTGSANVLLLDEPTNHLDLEGREALEAALSEYDGTVLLISHDRALVEGVATRTVVLHDERLTNVAGGYTQARAVLTGEQQVPVSPFAASAPGDGRRGRGTGDVSAAHTRTVRRRGEREDDGGARPRRRDRRVRSGGVRVRRPATIEREIEQLEAQSGEVQQQMLDPEVYTSPEKSAAALEEHARLEREITSRYEELERALEHHGA